MPMENFNYYQKDWNHHLLKNSLLANGKGIYTVRKTSIVSIRQTTGIKLLYTSIATVTMNLIVSAAIVLLNPYITVYGSTVMSVN